jgi:hypothetical protein
MQLLIEARAGHSKNISKNENLKFSEFQLEKAMSEGVKI